MARLQQADGRAKLRPVVLLKELPGFGDFLVCGVSSQLRQAIPEFDLVLEEGSDEFVETGLRVSSVVRLTFLAIVPVDLMMRRLGRIPDKVLVALQNRLAGHLTSGR